MAALQRGPIDLTTGTMGARGDHASRAATLPCKVAYRLNCSSISSTGFESYPPAVSFSGKNFSARNWGLDVSEARSCGRCGTKLDESKAKLCPACVEIELEEGREIDRKQVELLRLERERRRRSGQLVEPTFARGNEVEPSDQDER
jgi:hypothetical protein